MNRPSLDYYMGLPYKIEIIPEPDNSGYNVSVPDLKGCMVFGDTLDEAIEILDDVKQTWFELALEREWTIPEPIVEEKEYSGRFNVRLPRFLHRELAELAETEETSLNQLVVAFLSEGVGRRSYSVRRARLRSIKPFPHSEWVFLSSRILKAQDQPKKRRQASSNLLLRTVSDFFQLELNPE